MCHVVKAVFVRNQIYYLFGKTRFRNVFQVQKVATGHLTGPGT